ncbi:MAG: Gldg family protein [Phycisphaerales bacterium]|nr:Gldg family protein [Phycisphaerales bacterium]
MRELSAYFTNPTAYIFITLFVLLSGIAAFWVEAFFTRNLANLDQLNRWFPVLLLFLIPAVTMSAWAEERKQGTEELLLTLPAPEWKLALGKYLGCLAIYAVCLVFAASHIVVLMYLGRPDVGLLLSTYLGYLLAGGALIGLGLFASSLSASGTIAYIAGAVACGVMVSLFLLEPVLPAGVGPLLKSLSIPARMESFGRGVIDPADVLYFVAVAAVGVVLTAGVLRRRRSVGLPQGGAALHGVIRLASVVVIAGGAVLLLDRSGVRADATAERLWTLSPATRALMAQVPAGNHLTITAFVSPKTPPSLVQQRDTLDGMMRELAAVSGGKITVRTRLTVPNTEEARDAERSLGIKARAIPSEDGSVGGVQEVFLSVAVESAGGEVATVPFLSRGLPVEYELARAIRSVGTGERLTVGILETSAGLFGSFDFQTMSPKPDWPIIGELRKQYTVERVSPGADYPASVDVLLVAQPSTLNDEQLARLTVWIGAGKPTLIFEDPLPMINPGIATNEPKAQRSQFEPPDSTPKASMQPLWDLLGARIGGDAVVWDSFNPRPALAQTAGEFIWATPRKNIGFDPFAQESAITSGLQEVVLLFGGRIERLEAKAPAPSAAGQPAPPEPSRPEFKSLIRSGPTSGTVAYSTILTRSFFGSPQLNPNRRPTRVGSSQAMAAHITGGDRKLSVVLVADLDMVSDMFFAMREQGAIDLEFDNVPFVLNAVDALVGDQSLLELRKKRRTYRTLERIDSRRQDESEQMQKAEEAARAEAQAKLAEAQARVDQRVQEVSQRADLDQQSKEIMMSGVQSAEQARLTAQTVVIEQSRARAVEDARLAAKKNIDRIESGVRIAAVSLPPVPALLTGLVVMVRRRRAGIAPRADRWWRLIPTQTRY